MKRTFKRIISMFMSAVIFISMFSCCFGQAFALNENNEELVQRMWNKVKNLTDIVSDDEATTDEVSTGGLGEYSVLVSMLLDYGYYNQNTNSCFFVDEYEVDGKEITFMISWMRQQEKLVCSAMIDESLTSTMILDSNSLDGYLLGNVYEGSVEVYGTEWVSPGSYPYEIDFMMFDENGDYHNFSSSYEKSLNNKFNDATRTLIENCNTLMEEYVGMNLGNFGFTKMFTPKDYIVTTTRGDITYDANGGANAPAPQVKRYEKPLTLTEDVPTREGYRFLGWSFDSKSTTPMFFPGDVYTVEGDAVLYAIWTKVSSSESETDPAVRIVNNPGTLTVNIYTDVVISVETENMPDGAYVAWFINERQINTQPISTLTLQCTGAVDCVITVKICDKDGNVILNSDGKEIADSEIIITKGGFFLTIVGFFKKLFGLNQYVQ